MIRVDIHGQDLGGRQRVGHELRRIVVPGNDVDLLAAQLCDDGLDAGAPLADGRAHRVEAFLAGAHGDLAPAARLAGDRTDLDRAAVDLGHLELLILRLPELVGSPLSLNALREDLQVSHKTVVSWIGALERLFALFRLAPFGAPRIRAVKKAQKHYHLDWTVVPGDAARFENLVACHLLKWVHFEQDTQGRDLGLRYFRDIEGREVDFVVVEGRHPRLLVECKWGDAEVDRNMRYLKARFPEADAWQISATGTKDYRSPDGVRLAPAVRLLRTLV